jgi:signal transduction histidine kinase
VWADAGQLKQIALNLVLNAIEASPAGSVVRVSAEATGDMVELFVQDQGAGIPRENLETIFEPFFTTKESGTGLGLALVHQIVVEHGGEITVDSSVGVGTTFRFTMPLARALRRTGT